MSFIYRYETSTLTPFVKPHDILNLAVQNVFYIQLYVESAFMFNLGYTPKRHLLNAQFIETWYSVPGRWNKVAQDLSKIAQSGHTAWFPPCPGQRF